MSNTAWETMRREHLENRILGAHRVEIVAMLYQAAIDSLNEAIGCLKSGDRFARSRAVTRAEQAIHELLIALDHSVNPSFSRTSADLYRYVLARIVAGHARESKKAFEEALSILKPLASAWTTVKAQICAEPPSPAIEERPEDPRQAVKDPYGAYSEVPSESRDWSC